MTDSILDKYLACCPLCYQQEFLYSDNKDEIICLDCGVVAVPQTKLHKKKASHQVFPHPPQSDSNKNKVIKT